MEFADTDQFIKQNNIRMVDLKSQIYGDAGIM
jgi:hypothetical protein